MDIPFERICSEANIEGLHMMMTINALCLDSIVEFFPLDARDET